MIGVRQTGQVELKWRSTASSMQVWWNECRHFRRLGSGDRVGFQYKMPVNIPDADADGKVFQAYCTLVLARVVDRLPGEDCGALLVSSSVIPAEWNNYPAIARADTRGSVPYTNRLRCHSPGIHARLEQKVGCGENACSCYRRRWIIVSCHHLPSPLRTLLLAQPQSSKMRRHVFCGKKIENKKNDHRARPTYVKDR